MLEVKLKNFDDLTESQKEDQPNNGSGKEYANYIHITREGRTISIHSDAMEPEDSAFNRDLHWIIGEIKAAYEMGKKDA